MKFFILKGNKVEREEYKEKNPLKVENRLIYTKLFTLRQKSS